MPSISSDVPVRTGSFGREDRWLFWGRARLYANRLDLTAWSLFGKNRREISLDDIHDVTSGKRRLILELQNGEHVTLLMQNAARWAQAIRTHQEIEDGLR